MMEFHLYKVGVVCNAAVVMWKKILPLLSVVVLSGCTTTTFTNLSATQQPRNPTHHYPIEVRFDSTRQSLRWDSIQPYVIVGTESFPLQKTKLMHNRWEGIIPVPATTNQVTYFYKFDFNYNDFNKPPSVDSASSANFKLKIIDR